MPKLGYVEWLLCESTRPDVEEANKYPIAKILFSIGVSLSHNLYEDPAGTKNYKQILHNIKTF